LPCRKASSPSIQAPGWRQQRSGCTGTTLQYTINFQVSDYFAFNQLNIGDLLPDGVRFDQAFTPTLSITQHTDLADNTGNSATAAFNAANYLSPVPTTFNAGDGTQTLNFAVSNELITRGQSGTLIGGNIPQEAPGRQSARCSQRSAVRRTTGTIVFRAIVQQQYSVKTSPLGNKDIKQGDSITNVVPNVTGRTSVSSPAARCSTSATLPPPACFRRTTAAPPSPSPRPALQNDLRHQRQYEHHQPLPDASG